MICNGRESIVIIFIHMIQYIHVALISLYIVFPQLSATAATFGTSEMVNSEGGGWKRVKLSIQYSKS